MEAPKQVELELFVESHTGDGPVANRKATSEDIKKFNEKQCENHTDFGVHEKGEFLVYYEDCWLYTLVTCAVCERGMGLR